MNFIVDSFCVTPSVSINPVRWCCLCAWYSCVCVHSCVPPLPPMQSRILYLHIVSAYWHTKHVGTSLCQPHLAHAGWVGSFCCYFIIFIQPDRARAAIPGIHLKIVGLGRELAHKSESGVNSGCALENRIYPNPPLTGGALGALSTPYSPTRH